MRNKSFRGNSAHFLALRKRLDIMGYNDLPLGLDTAPLAQQMLEDLVATTDRLKEEEEIIDGLREKVELAAAQIEPLQSENTQLTRDNTQLHKAIIDSKDEIMKLKNQHIMVTFDLKAENRRLALLNKQAAEQVQLLSNNIEDLKNKLQASIAMPSISKIAEVIESDPMKLKKGSKSNESSTSAPSKSKSGSSISVQPLNFDPTLFNTELTNLRRERDEARKLYEVSNHRIAELEESMKFKDDEILRLGEELKKQTGQDGYLITLKHKCQTQEQLIEKLQTQLSALNPSDKPKMRNRKIKMILTKPITTVLIENGIANANSVVSSIRNQDFESIGDAEEDDFVSTPRSAAENMNNLSSNGPAREELDSQKQIYSDLKSKFEQLEKTSSEALQQKDLLIDSLKQENEEMSKKLVEKDQTISQMAADFAYINDNISSIVEEKDYIINNYSQRNKIDLSSFQDTSDELRNLYKEFDSMKRSYESQIQQKDEELRRSRLSKSKPCQECTKLKQQIEEMQKKKPTVTFSQSQLENQSQMKERLVTLENHLKHMGKTPTSISDISSSESSEFEMKIMEQQETIARLQKDLKDTQSALEESEQKLYSLPDAESRLRTLVETLRSENLLMKKEIKARQSDAKNIKDRMTELQQINQEQQIQLQKARNEAASCKDESESCRNRYQQITKKANEKNYMVVRDANSAIQKLQKQLSDKENECEMYQKLLSETRRQLSPLTEQSIPQYQAQMSQMKKERDTLINIVKRIAQLAASAERSNADMFSTTVRQLQNEIRRLGI